METTIQCAGCGNPISGKEQYCKRCLRQADLLFHDSLLAEPEDNEKESSSFTFQVAVVVALTAIAMGLVIGAIVHFL